MENNSKAKDPGSTSDSLEKAFYLYCFVISEKLPAIEGAGIDDQNPLFLIQGNGIAAVMSRVDLADFIGPEGETNLQDIEWIGPRAYRHQAVIEKAMGKSPVLPARFGTLYVSDESIQRLLTIHHETISVCSLL